MASTPSLADLDEKIAEERAAIHAYLDDRIIPLMVRRRLLQAGTAPPAPPADAPAAAPEREPSLPFDLPARPAAEAAPARPPAPGPARAPDPDPVEGEEAGALARRLRASSVWSTARIIMWKLETGPREGFRASKLGEALQPWGYSLVSAQNTLWRLRRMGAIVLDARSRTWSLTEAYRAGIPAGTRIELGDGDWGSAPPPAEHPAGRIILGALREGPPRGMRKQDLVERVVAAGFTESLCDYGLKGLALAEAIARDPKTNLWTIRDDEGEVA